MVFYDIGANIGIHSLILAREHPDCQIHAFEPETLNFWKLLRNITLNKLENITPHLIAAGAKREVRFPLPCRVSFRPWPALAPKNGKQSDHPRGSLEPGFLYPPEKDPPS